MKQPKEGVMEKGQVLRSELYCIVCRNSVKGSDISGGDYPSNPRCQRGHDVRRTSRIVDDVRRVIDVDLITGTYVFEEK